MGWLAESGASDGDDDGTHDSFELGVDSRGWSVRHGRRKRLGIPKRGKAAIRAEIQGQGKEVLRGRSAFKRSKNTGRCGSPEYMGKYGADYPIKRRRAKLQNELRNELADAEEGLCACAKYSGLGIDIEDEAEEVEAEEPVYLLAVSGESFLETCSQSSAESELSWSTDGSSITSTAASLEDIQGVSRPFNSKLTRVLSSIPTAWEVAVARAERMAKQYASYLRKHGPPQPLLPNDQRRQQRSNKIPRHVPKPSLRAELLRMHNTHLSTCFLEPIRRKAQEAPLSFENFRRRFLEAHGRKFCQSLQTCFHGPISLQPTPLHPEVQERFLEMYSGSEESLCPAFHGTDARNLSSIYKHGLLIPGMGNRLRVTHGSAHGLGIYTATVDNPGLSFGFCRGETSMLVCGVLDDSVRGSEVEYLGRHAVTSRSKDVLHVGSAMVIFDSKRVAPLFVATRRAPPARPARASASPDAPARRRRGTCAGPKTRIRPSFKGVVSFLLRRGAQRRRDST